MLVFVYFIPVNGLLNVQYDHPQSKHPSTALSIYIKNETYFSHLLHSTFGREVKPINRPVTSHRHDVFHIVLVTEGSGTYLIQGKACSAKPGSIFIISPGEEHCLLNTGKEIVRDCEITFEFRSRSGKVLRSPFHEVLSIWASEKCKPIYNSTVSPRLFSQITEDIEQIVRTGLYREENPNLLFTSLLSRIFLNLFTNLLTIKPVESQRIHPMLLVKQYIQKNYSHSLSLAELAKMAVCTPNYLSRRFKEIYGITPISYQIRLRLLSAAHSLRTTELTIKDISQQTGFEDVYFFSKMFKKMHGQPPARFRSMSKKI
jgi:AraC-like DNA-binding protein/mannose-6-phosphate isomerase-like protein (cupin superfamily)